MIVVDASVAVKWFVAEADSETALTLFRSSSVLMCPDHAFGEIGEVLVRSCRRGRLTHDDVRRANDAIAGRLAFRSPLPLIDLATGIALGAAISFYDALYVAAADRWHLTLVTADARLVASVAGTPWQRCVVLLSAWRGEREP
ncbi:type II toxin-antitoxin system VapC family toxin [Methylobacterium sp. WL69]|uniref:type II toxin-antitoxin system VapC family toxin n=1 Tax=Methylobacterium sp. WL69 TaxID=2603893 RepID=UPI0011C92F9B|nr:type II toxin-antitoxin system VapC family toxin [Methylobacterium sp. WL69]TXM79318.1 type II toxin-antitoxin system VapC family toxin [Methylobacterium sp. WL69]